MKIFRQNEIEGEKRPDGRIIKQIGDLILNQEVKDIHFLQAYHPSKFTEQQHSHEKSYEILYFLDQAKYVVNEGIYNINAGDIVVLEPGDKHGALESDNEANILVIRVPWISDDKVNY